MKKEDKVKIREIKFRAWHISTKRWISIFQLDNQGNLQIETGDSDIWKNIAPVDYILMQFIGLKDKSGKEIYEMDKIIVTDEHGNEDRGFLKYNEKEMAFVIDWGENRYRRIMDDGERIEIIGNIYENPELLTSSETKKNNLKG